MLQYGVYSGPQNGVFSGVLSGIGTGFPSGVVPSGPSWAQMTTTGTAPIGRFLYQACYCGPLAGTLVFGGTVDGGNALPGDLYLLGDDGTWSILTTTFPGTGFPPPTRWGGGMCYNNADGLVHLVSGYDSLLGTHARYAVNVADHWTLDPNALVWSDVSNFSTGPKSGVYSSLTAGGSPIRMMWAPGLAASGNTSDIYTAVNTSEFQVMATGPSARQRITAAYDSQRGLFVVVGGNDDTTTYDTTWETSGDPTDPDAWVNRTDLTGSPGMRQGALMAYGPGLGTVLFGGYPGTGSVYIQNTQIYDGTTWTTPTLATQPPARGLGTMVWSGGLQKFVVFGGDGAGLGHLNDVWTFGQQ